MDAFCRALPVIATNVRPTMPCTFVEGLSEDADLMSVAQSLSSQRFAGITGLGADYSLIQRAWLSEAVKGNASDIHIEPFENRPVDHACRVDGVAARNPGAAPGPWRRGQCVAEIKSWRNLDIAAKAPALREWPDRPLKTGGRAGGCTGCPTLPQVTASACVASARQNRPGPGTCATGYGQGFTTRQMERVLPRPHGIVLVRADGLR